MKKMYGVSPAVLTPFNKEGNFNENVFIEHIDFLIESGVHCLYFLGTTAQVFLLSNKERKRITEIAITHVNRRVPVFIHIGSIPTKEAVELAKHAERAGADGIGAIVPYYYNISQDEIADYYIEIASAVRDDFPVYLYNLPECTVNDLVDSTVVSLSKTKNIVGLKHSLDDYTRLASMCTVFGEKFDIICGNDILFLPSLIVGALGVVSGNSNVIPKLFVDLYEAYIKGDIKTASKKNKEIIKFILFSSKYPSLSFFNEILSLRGVERTYVRRPIRELSDLEKIQIKKEFNANFKKTCSLRML